MRYSLRYETVGDDEGMRYHLGNADMSAACGAAPTDLMPVAEHVAEALDILLRGRGYPDVDWCPACVDLLAQELTARVTFAAGRPLDRHASHVDPDAPLSPADERALGDLAAALDPDPDGRNA